jgi:putative transposase
MLRAVELKLYLTVAQRAALESWLRSCCRLYNRCLEQRIKAYRRRGESVTYNQQTALLTTLRGRIPALAEVPVEFARDALRRVDRGFQAFFRRTAAGQKPGFPRFRPHQRYTSLESLRRGSYLRPGNRLRVPNLGLVKCRAGDQPLAGEQKILRVLRRASGWYAQLVIDDGQAAPGTVPVTSAVGIDVGLDSFATLDTGEKVPNPRCLRKAERKLRRAQRRLSHCQRRSRNRQKAVRRIARVHEQVAAQRKDFAHQLSRRLVNRFDLIAFEALNVKGLAMGRNAKSVHDAAWGLFLFFMTYKAENAGRHAVAVEARGTSQECPACGRVAPKPLSERVHRCPCGLILDRDHAAAQVIRARALRVVGATACGGTGPCPGSSSGVSRPDETGSLDGATHH